MTGAVCEDEQKPNESNLSICAIVNKLIGSQLLHSELSDRTFLQRTMSSALVINRLIKPVKWNKVSREKLNLILLFYVSDVMAWAAVEV